MRNIVLVCIFSITTSFAQIQNDWENQKIVGRNKEPYHVAVIPYADLAGALTNDKTQSPYYKSLNGVWKFKYATSFLQSPKDFYKIGYDISKWDSIKVPGNMELQGFGTPVFRNIAHPFTASNPPFIPENEIPVGSYVRSFSLPTNWTGRQVFINFDGVESAYNLYVNGQKVGYSENSYSPSEFDLTKYVKQGKNTIAVQVFRYSDGSYLEDQDFWRLSGIFRTVYMYAKPTMSVADYKIETDFDETYTNATLKINLKINQKINPSVAAKNVKTEKLSSADFTLYDQDKKIVFTGKSNPKTTKSTDFSSTIAFETLIKTPNKWNSENPYLYTLVMNIKNDKGAITEILSTKIGFREIEILNGVLCLNGNRLIIRGVNRHEHDMTTGRYITKESMVKDVKLMKEFNINAVRNSHYPNVPEWYDICDEYGIYLCDEANLESHFHWDKFTKDSTWIIPFMDRLYGMVEPRKNHTSVIYWSLGNESGFGPNHVKMSDWVRKNEKTRPVHYNPADRDSSVDIIGQMYPSVEHFISNAIFDKRPVIMCEYSHAMGNSAGNLIDYWNPVYTMPRAQGGFIWDWVDQGFLRVNATGKPYFANGGEMNDTLSEKYTAFDGMVLSDRTPQPELFEFKYVVQPVRMSLVDAEKGIIKIKNWHETLNLNQYDMSWVLKENGKKLQSGNITDFELAAGQEKSLQIPLDKFATKNGKEYFMEVHFKIKEANSWTNKGHLVAYDQFKLTNNLPRLVMPIPMADKNFKVTESAQQASILGNNFSIVFSKQSGKMVSFIANNIQLITSGPEACFWRAPTENDDTQISANGQSAYNWKRYGLNSPITTVKNFKINLSKNNIIELKVVQNLGSKDFPELMENVFTYTIFASGEVIINQQVSLKEDMNFLETYGLARVGMQMVLPKQFEDFSYFGRGPWENYSDRKESAMVDYFQSTVTDQYFPYSVPQATGNHADTRWASLRDKNGVGLAAYGFPTFETTALHYSNDDLSQKSSANLYPQEAIFWNIDFMQSGIGSASCGPGVRPEYIVPIQNYNYTIRLKPLISTDVVDDFMFDSPKAMPPILVPEINGVANTGKLMFLPSKNNIIRYTIDGSAPTQKSPIYTLPFRVGKDDVRAITFSKTELSSVEVTYKNAFLYEKYAKDTLRFREKNIIAFKPTEEDIFKSNVVEKLLADTDTVMYGVTAKKIEVDLNGLKQIRIKFIDIDKSTHWDHFVFGEPYFTKKDGSIVHLSDLNIAFDEQFRRDLSIDKNPLQVNKKVFRKGIGVHTTNELWCDFVTKDFVQFNAYFGTDDEINGYGSGKASLRVYGVE